MAKTYTTVPSVNTGDVYTAANYNAYTAMNISNLIVPPMCQMVITASQALATSGADATLTSSSFAIDTDSMSGTTNRITIATAGVYLVSYSIQFGAKPIGTLSATVALNGTGSANSGTGIAPTTLSVNATVPTSVINTKLVSLNANDYLTLVGFQNSGASLSLTSVNQYLQALWIGRTS